MVSSPKSSEDFVDYSEARRHHGFWGPVDRKPTKSLALGAEKGEKETAAGDEEADISDDRSTTDGSSDGECGSVICASCDDDDDDRTTLDGHTDAEDELEEFEVVNVANWQGVARGLA